MSSDNVQTSEDLVDSIADVASAISANRFPVKDAAHFPVSSLAEAIMGNTAALVMIADAIDNLAEVVRCHGD
jgi:hypothetical protein